MKPFASLACFVPLAMALSAPAFAQVPPAQTPLPPSVSGAGGGRATATPEMAAARRNVRSSCAADVASLCAETAAASADTAPANAQPGGRGGARMLCLRDHVAQVSPTCRQALAARRDARKAAKT